MPRFRPLLGLLLLLPVLLLLTAQPGAARAEVIVVPPGNRSATQPPISTSSVIRTAETNGTFKAKFRTIYNQLASDRQLIQKIEKAAAVYGIDPIHMIGAIVGEHTYNVDAMDTLQGYYVKALAYLGAKMTFAHDGEDVRDFVKRPQFAACANATDDYDLWTCREDVWKAKFQGKTVDGKAFPNDRFQRVFFQPYFAGQTFGLGQLSPLAALTVSDIVAARSGLPPLDLNHPNEIYHAVMDPDMSLDYMAAIIAHDIAGLPADRRLRYLAEPRHHRHALQPRRCRRSRPCAGRGKPQAPRQRPRRRLSARELLRLAGERPPRRIAQAALAGRPLGPAQPHQKRAGAAMRPAGLVEADDHRPQFVGGQPDRHQAAQDPALLLAAVLALAGDHQHQPRARGLGRRAGNR